MQFACAIGLQHQGFSRLVKDNPFWKEYNQYIRAHARRPNDGQGLSILGEDPGKSPRARLIRRFCAGRAPSPCNMSTSTFYSRRVLLSQRFPYIPLIEIAVLSLLSERPNLTLAKGIREDIVTVSTALRS
jgi:hypothetical protein